MCSSSSDRLLSTGLADWFGPCLPFAFAYQQKFLLPQVRDDCSSGVGNKGRGFIRGCHSVNECFWRVFFLPLFRTLIGEPFGNVATSSSVLFTATERLSTQFYVAFWVTGECLYCAILDLMFVLVWQLLFSMRRSNYGVKCCVAICAWATTPR